MVGLAGGGRHRGHLGAGAGAIAGGTVGRPHVAQALVDAGLVPALADAFTPEWIGTGGRHWVGKLELDVLEAIALVARCGRGGGVRAPRGHRRAGAPSATTRWRRWPQAGLAGLEVDHVDHTPPAREHLRGLAAELGLLTTGSSDFHGAAQDGRPRRAHDRPAGVRGRSSRRPPAYAVVTA